MTARGPDTLREPEQSSVAPYLGASPEAIKAVPRIRGAHGPLVELIIYI